MTCEYLLFTVSPENVTLIFLEIWNMGQAYEPLSDIQQGYSTSILQNKDVIVNWR